MSSKSSPRRRRSGSAPRASMLRLVALSTVGLTLFGAAYQSAFAGIGNPAPLPLYPSDRGDGDSGLTSVEIGAIAVVGTGLVATTLAASGVFGGGGEDESGGSAKAFPIGGPRDADEPRPELPAGHAVEAVNVVPQRASLDAGYGRSFHLLARSRQDGKWYSVTRSPQAQFRLQDGGSSLLAMDGSKNTFLLPITAPRSADGRTTRIVATYRNPEGELQSEAELALRVPRSAETRGRDGRLAVAGD